MAAWTTQVSSSYEECRAECVGLYLCSVPEVLTIFGHDATQLPEGSVHDVTYGNWLIMVRAGQRLRSFASSMQM